jgi:hypothetical protein
MPQPPSSPETLSASFNRLTAMYTGDRLRDVIAEADRARTPDNLAILAGELYGILNDQMWFILGNEDLWEGSVVRMQAIAEEAAGGGSARACLYAGVISARDWAIGAKVTSHDPVTGASQNMDVERAPVIRGDLQRALSWFEKGAALGDELCSANAHKARLLMTGRDGIPVMKPVRLRK